MALTQSLQLKINEDGVLTDVYMNIPRSQDKGFNIFTPKYVTFPFNIWASEQARIESDTDTTIKPARTITVRMLDCTQEDITGTEGTPAVIEDGEVVQEAVAPKEGMRGDMAFDTYNCSFNHIINNTNLLQFIADHMMDDDGNGNPIGDVEARKLGIVYQFYNWIKVNETDMCGIDMTQSDDVPPVNP